LAEGQNADHTAPLIPEHRADARHSGNHAWTVVTMRHGNDLAIAVQEITIPTFTRDSFSGSY
jgi:hypothetical protein